MLGWKSTNRVPGWKQACRSQYLFCFFQFSDPSPAFSKLFSDSSLHQRQTQQLGFKMCSKWIFFQKWRQPLWLSLLGEEAPLHGVKSHWCVQPASLQQRFQMEKGEAFYFMSLPMARPWQCFLAEKGASWAWHLLKLRTGFRHENMAEKQEERASGLPV